ncbi:MAG: metallophosphoesterase, partial [Pirellulaceae bacterium]
EDIYNERKMESLFGRIQLYCFQGHTHIPGVFTSGGEFISPEDCEFHYELDGEKSMVNVGSVGQPRDGDPRACYVILDTTSESLEYRRVDYDFNVTAGKIYNNPELNDTLGDRLKGGR